MNDMVQLILKEYLNVPISVKEIIYENLVIGTEIFEIEYSQNNIGIITYTLFSNKEKIKTKTVNYASGYRHEKMHPHGLFEFLKDTVGLYFDNTIPGFRPGSGPITDKDIILSWNDPVYIFTPEFIINPENLSLYIKIETCDINDFKILTLK